MRTNLSSTEFVKIVVSTAEHFGFRSLESLRKEPGCKECIDTITPSIEAGDMDKDQVGGLLTHGLTVFCQEKIHGIETPVQFYTVHDTKAGDVGVSLHIYNVPKSIAEAVLIQTNRAIANELDASEHSIRINSLGDSDSLIRYTREITNFLRRRLEYIPVEARELMKQHPLLAMQHLADIDHELSYKSPNPLEYLSDQSRKHFRDIIEFLDMSEAPYEIDTKMLGHHEYYSDAIFDLSFASEEEDAAITLRGGRYDEFVFRKTKKRIPAAGSVAILHNKTLPSRLPRLKNKAPDTYVIQLGFGPKVRSLLLLDNLRKAGVMVHHDLANDSLSAQLRHAEELGVKFVLIMGQKEYVDGTIIMRDMHARKQEAIDPDLAIRRLKRGIGVTVA